MNGFNRITTLPVYGRTSIERTPRSGPGASGMEATAMRVADRPVMPAGREWKTLLVLAPVVMAMLTTGCGFYADDDAAREAHARKSGVAPGTSVAEHPAPSFGEAEPMGAGITAEVEPASTPLPEAERVAMAEGYAASAQDALPPDIVVSASDTLALPGEVIELTVRGTPDVSEISLWDGLSDRQGFHYDTSSDQWSVLYRVPLSPRSERLGLSVTAKNAADRWRRVWVFVTVQKRVADDAVETSALLP